jgi:hypothetical protein
VAQTRGAGLHLHALIIKLDAMGDVLRTTSLLPLIANAYPGATVTWITRPESVPLLQNNPYVSDVVAYGPDSVVHLGAREFDYAINMDASRISAGMLALARARHKTGFLLHPQGYVVPTNAGAAAWLEMGTNDVLKREGTRTYQSWMKRILEFDDQPVSISGSSASISPVRSLGSIRGLVVDGNSSSGEKMAMLS